MDRAEMSDVGKESNKRLRAKSDGEKSNEQRKRFSNTETVSHWREDSFQKIKNSLDDLFIFL